MSPDAISVATKWSEIRFWPGLRLYPAGGAHSSPPHLLLDALRGPTCHGRGRVGKRKGQKESEKRQDR